MWDRQEEAESPSEVDQNQSVGWAMDVCTYGALDELTVRLPRKGFATNCSSRLAVFCHSLHRLPMPVTTQDALLLENSSVTPTDAAC